MNTAVVLSMSEAGLGISRCLGRRGIEIFGVDYKSNAENFSSKFCKRKLIFANPETHPEQCLHQFLEVGKSLDEKGVLLPTNDYYVKFISIYRKELRSFFHFNIPDAEILDAILDKQKQYKLAEQIGIATPKTISPSNLDHLLQEEKSLSYPLFIKGTKSYLWFWQFRNKGFVANNIQELRKYYDLATGNNLQAIIQEIVIGPNKNHFEVNAYYSAENILRGIFCTQKTRQFPIDFGNGTYFISQGQPELCGLGRKLFEGLGYTGMGVIEFKLDERDGAFKMIELNPRFTQQYIHSVVAGVDFAYLNYLDCIGEKFESSLTYPENISYVDPLLDFLSFLQNKKRGEIALSEWIRSIRRSDCIEYFAKDDLKPGIYYLLRSSRRFLNKTLGKT